MANSALIEELRKQFADNPRRVFARLANEYRKSGQLDMAIEICQGQVPQQPTYISGHIVLGQALFESGRLDEARSTFETALGLDPENLIALRQLGDIARAGGDDEGARVWYHRLLEVDPQNEEVAAQLAEMEPAPAAGADTEVSWSDINPERASVRDEPHGAHDTGVAAPQTAAVDPEPEEELLDISALQPDAASGADAARAAPGSTAGAAASPASITFPDTLDLDFAALAVNRPVAETEPSAAPEPMAAEADPASAPDELLSIDGLLPGSGMADAVGAAAAPVVEAPDDEPLDLELLSVEPVAGLEPTSAAEPEPDAAARGAGDDLALPVMDIDIGSLGAEPVEPPPNAEGEAGEAPAPAAFVTETMAELYLQQGFPDRALAIYRQLSAQRPDDAALRERVARLEWGGAPPSDGANGAEPPRRTMRTFFGTFATRRPPAAMAHDVAAPEPPHEPVAAASVPDAPAPDAPEPELAPTAPAPNGASDTPPWGRAASARRDDLGTMFGGGAPAEADARAATALAGAFSEEFAPGAGLGGQPARAANDALSLDDVFRGGTPRADGGARRSAPNVSFDEFFSRRDAGAEAPPEAPPAPPEGASSDEERDLELFHAWLEGLKK